MRRAAAAIIGTIAGTTLLVGAKFGVVTPQDAATNANPVAGVVDGTSASAGGSTSAGGSSAAALSPGPGQPVPSGSRAPGAPTPGTPGTPGGTKTTTPASAPTTGGGGTGLKDGTFTGSGTKERYGTITVTVTVSGGHLTNLSATCGGCNGESQSISSNAFTRLRQEALSAQSASIATVSGATYTSGAYKTSLQAALNAAKA